MSDTIQTQKSTNIPENKMGVMNVNKLLITMSLPMIFSMMVQALYNVIDSIFVAQIGESALTAVSLAFPIQNLMIAVAVGTGVGINSLLSRSLGAKKYEEVSLTANNGVFLGVCSYLLFAVFGLFFSKIYFESQTSDPAIIQYGIDYMLVVTVFSVGLFMQITFERLLQATGQTFYNMITQCTGAVINIILDPILILGLFGLPRLEVKGAAIATVIGQIIGAIFCYYLNKKKNKEIHLQLKHFRPNLLAIRKIYSVGFPSMVMQSITSILTLGLNKILMFFSPTAVSVFGIYFKLQSFIFMPVFGLTNGMIPIVAFNFGAKNKKRILDTIKLATIISLSFMFVGLLIFQIFPVPLLNMFNASPEMMSIGVPALRIISLSFVLAGYSIILVSVFQALGHGFMSLSISVIRQLIIILPAAYLFAVLLGLNAVWWAFPLAELAAVVLSSIMGRIVYHKTIKDLETKNNYEFSNN